MSHTKTITTARQGCPDHVETVWLCKVPRKPRKRKLGRLWACECGQVWVSASRWVDISGWDGPDCFCVLEWQRVDLRAVSE